MNERINEIAIQAGVTGYFAADTKLATPIPLSPEIEKFAELIVAECSQALNPMLRDMISRGQAVELIKERFGIE